MEIIGILVLYNPDVVLLHSALRHIIPQLDLLVMVDNSTNNQSLEGTFSTSKTLYIKNRTNLGIAEAQNIGILQALSYSPKYIVFFDQDSIPACGMIDVLIAELQKLVHQGLHPGIIGPSIINRNTHCEYQGMIKKGYRVSESIVKVDDLISSGSVIPLNVLQDVGLMDSKLFIDGVDHEWCWRARKKGYSCYLSKAAKLEHFVGQGNVRFLGIPIMLCTPFRIYYVFRNYFTGVS